jgi:hypothetical protein
VLDLVLLVTTPGLLEYFNRRNNKKKRTICDAVKDHIIPHLTRKTHAYDMWEYLCNLYKSTNENWKLVLHDQLGQIHMIGDESITSFLGRYTHIGDELGAMGEVVDPDSMVRKTLKIFTKPWGPFIWDCFQGRYTYMGEDVG